MAKLSFPFLMVAALLAGCVQKVDVQRDAQLRVQAQTAFDGGDFRLARAVIAQADRLYVPQAELWRRTLEMRIALAEGSPQGDLHRFFRAWGEQRSDWSLAEEVDATLTLAETLRPELAIDFLHELNPNIWPAAQRTRYNLLMSHLQQGQPALRDDTAVRWRLAIRGLYDAGDLISAAREAKACARSVGSAEVALLAARLYTELGSAAERADALELAVRLSPGEATARTVAEIAALPLGTPTTF